MIFVIDVGNTNTVMGVYQQKTLLHTWRMSTHIDRTSDEYGMFFISMFRHAELEFNDMSGIVISSVVPPVMYSLEHAVHKYFGKGPMIIGPGMKTGLNLKVEVPSQVGADRIVNAVGALEKYQGPMIVVDFGTATTFCALSSQREYLGGAIMPGMKISADALFERASKLPKVELIKPEHVIGKNTVQSMQSGLLYGHAGAVDSMIKKMKTDLLRYENRSCKVITLATGGLARLIDSICQTIDVIEPNLTLQGLQVLYEKNHG